MSSVGSNSPSPSPSDDTTSSSSMTSMFQPITDRIIRALTHPLALLHRSDPQFHVLGSTGNVYTITISSPSPSCTCPDRVVPCKHILFILLRVLTLPLDDVCVYRRALRPCHIARALSMPTGDGVWAGARAVERFRQVVVVGGGGEGNVMMMMRGGSTSTCPVCLEEMEEGEGRELATCGTCGNSVHGECMGRWKRSRGRRGVSCVVCRARWRERREEEDKYVNLGGYVDNDIGDGGLGMCTR